MLAITGSLMNRLPKLLITFDSSSNRSLDLNKPVKMFGP